MNYEAKQWKYLAEGTLFDLAVAVLGERSLFAKLFHRVGFDEARKILKMAATKSDPREYIGAVLSKRQEQQGPPLSEAKIEELFAKYKEKMARTA